MVTGPQVRAARALLGWSAAELSSRAGVSLSTVHRVEASSGTPNIQARNLAAIEGAFAAAGVELIDAHGASAGTGVGVRFRR